MNSSKGCSLVNAFGKSLVEKRNLSPQGCDAQQGRPLHQWEAPLPTSPDNQLNENEPKRLDCAL